MKRITLIICLLLTMNPLVADEIYQRPRDFIKEVFVGVTPLSHSLWVTKNRRQTVEEILEQQPKSLRVQFWEQGLRSAWVLEADAKDYPITTGIVINAGKIEQIKILGFRERHGAGVLKKAFTDQFIGAKITKEHVLTKDINAVSGAKQSVRAITAMARLALYYHAEIQTAP